MRVVVIGAGSAGSSAARFLACAGHAVTVFEQHRVGHALGSSHGASRIIRRTYADPSFTKLMDETWPLWHELEYLAGETLYHEVGLLSFGRPESPWLRAARDSLAAHGVKWEELGPTDAARRFGIALDRDETALFEPAAGWLRADRVIAANLRLARAHGATLVEGQRVEPRSDGTVAGVRCDAIVICAGPWVRRLVPDLPVSVHLQHTAYFDAPARAAMPVWVSADEDFDYGIPDHGLGFKVGRHRVGAPFDPESSVRAADPAVVAGITACAARRLGATGAPRSVETCLYTVARDDRFLIRRVPGAVPTFVVSACSGHAFKFGVWLGKRALDLVEGRVPAADP